MIAPITIASLYVLLGVLSVVEGAYEAARPATVPGDEDPHASSLWWHRAAVARIAIETLVLAWVLALYVQPATPAAALCLYALVFFARASVRWLIMEEVYNARKGHPPGYRGSVADTDRWFRGLSNRAYLALKGALVLVSLAAWLPLYHTTP